MRNLGLSQLRVGTLCIVVVQVLPVCCIFLQVLPAVLSRGTIVVLPFAVDNISRGFNVFMVEFIMKLFSSVSCLHFFQLNLCHYLSLKSVC